MELGVDRAFLKLPRSRRRKIVKGRIRSLVKDIVSASAAKNDLFERSSSEQARLTRRLASELFTEMSGGNFLERAKEANSTAKDTGAMIDEVIATVGDKAQ